MGMDVFIFGVGCSGTTMAYSLLQSIFARLYGGDYYSTYEPFIWDREKFNQPYDKTSSLFGRTSSMSVEGVYNHIKTALFVDSASGDDFLRKEFFRHFSSTQGPNQPHLAKLIRGNGRMSIFRALNPQAQFVLMLRNPVDNINCAKYKFSFYGDDFYPSDYPRFCKYLSKMNQLVLDTKNAKWAQRQAEYCYQMNRAAVDFAVSDGNTKILEYNSFIRDKSSSVAELLNCLEIPRRGDYASELERPTGPVTASNVLSQAEYESILYYDDLYTEMCVQARVKRGKSKKEIQKQYDGRCSAKDFDEGFGDSTTNRLRGKIRSQEKQIQQLKLKIDLIKNN